MARTRSDIGPRIVEAARDRFLREGVDGASLRAIASDAGTSIGMVYYYFPTKDDLFFAVIEETYAALLDDLSRALAPDVAVEERLRRLYHRMGALTEQETVIVRLVVRELLTSNARLGRLLERFMRGHIPLVLATIRDGIGDGTLTGDRHPILLALATIAVGAVPQFILARAGDKLPFAAGVPHGPALGDALVKILLAGIGGHAKPAGARPAPAPPRAAKAKPARARIRRTR